jgi:hypothetical protein
MTSMTVSYTATTIMMGDAISHPTMSTVTAVTTVTTTTDVTTTVTATTVTATTVTAALSAESLGPDASYECQEGHQDQQDR